MSKRLYIIILVLLSVNIISAQEMNDPSVETLSTDFMVRPAVKVNFPFFAITYKDVRIQYQPSGLPVQVGGTINYKNFGFSYFRTLNSDDDTRGNSNDNSFMTTWYTRSFGIDVLYQKSEGFYLFNPEDFYLNAGDDETKFSGVSQTVLSTTFIYAFNDQLSLRAIKDQSERQIRNEQSFLITGSVDYNRIKSDSSLIPASEQANFGDKAGYDGGDYYGVFLGPGYGASEIVNGKWYYTWFVGAGPSLTFVKNSQEEDDTVITVKLRGRGGYGYNGDSFFGGLFLYADYTLTDLIASSDAFLVQYYSFAAELFAGVRF